MIKYRRRWIFVVILSLCILLVGCSDKGNQLMMSKQGVSQFSAKAIPEINQIDWQKELDQDVRFSFGKTNVYYWRDQDIYALDYKTGQEQWKIQSKNRVSTVMDVQGITLVDDDDYILNAYESTDGTAKWERDIGDYFDLLTVSDNIVVLADIHNNLIGINLETGEEEWSTENVGQYSKAVTPIFKDAVYVQADQSSIVAVNVKTGKVKSKIELKNRGQLWQYMIAEDTLYTLNYDLGIDAYDLKSGEFKWSYTDNLSSFMAYYDEEVYSVNSGTINTIDSKKGHHLRTIFSSDSDRITPISIAGDELYFGLQNASGGAIVAVDASKESVQWKYQLSNSILSQPYIFNDSIYAIDSKWSIVALGNQKPGNKPVSKVETGSTKVLANKDELSIHGLTLGNSTDEVVKALGMPDDKQMDDELKSLIYKYKGVEFLFVNDKVTAIKTNDKEYQTKQGIRPSSLLKDILSIYNGYEGYFGKRFALVKKDDLLLVFNLGRFFDDDPFSVGSMSIMNITGIKHNPMSAEGYYLSNLIGSEGVSPSLLESEFEKIDATQIDVVTEKIRFGEIGEGNEQAKVQNIDDLNENKVAAESNIIEGLKAFEGDWCDSMQALCFRLELTDVNRGSLEYYQDLDPLKEEFKITYMDEFSLEIEVEGLKKATLSLSSDKNNLTYETDAFNESMIRQ